MPINKQEFENGKLHCKVEEEITFFLNERRERAFTSQEIMEGIRYHTEFTTPEISKMSTFAVADFTTFLQHLVKEKKIVLKVVRNRMYFMHARGAKCPKCGVEVAEPRKTWNMAGRPNRKGERLQLHIGLFECPEHGVFRTVLDKKRIPAGTTKKSRRKKTKRKQPRKRTLKKKPAKKKEKRKRSDAWILA